MTVANHGDSQGAHRVPDQFDEIRAAFEYLLSCGLENKDPKEVPALLEPLFTHWQGQWIYLGENQVWHRGRKIDDAKGYQNISDVSINRDSQYGRAHMPFFQPMFYASRCPATVYPELDAQSGDYLQMVMCRVRPGDRCKAGIVGEWEQINNSGLSLIGYDKSIQTFEQMVREDPERALESLLVDSLFAEVFSKRAKGEEYALSAYIAQIILQQGGAALMYPSVQHRGGLNIAVCEKEYDELFVIECCDIVHVRDLGGGVFMPTPVRMSERIEADGTIVWAKTIPVDRKISWSVKGGTRF